MNEDQQKKLQRLMDEAGQKVRLELRWGADALLHQHVMRAAVASLAGLTDEIPEEILIRRAESIYTGLIATMQKQLDEKTALEIFL